MITPETKNGAGLDAVWADDFHHQVRRALAGDREGYYCDFSGSLADLATTIRQGWFFCGQHSHHLNGPRGTDPVGRSPQQFVICLQNHDQIGNRALGDRIHHQIDLASYRAASVLFLCAPQTPLLYMGQEWAATAPFLYFTDHNLELGKLITQGRRREFSTFSAFSDPEARARIPDPQEVATFTASRLNWSELTREPHASIGRLYHTLLHLRRTEPALRDAERGSFDVVPLGERALLLLRTARSGSALLAVVQLKAAGHVDLGHRVSERELLGKRKWQLILNTEDRAFSPDPTPPIVNLSPRQPKIDFARPSAVLLRSEN